jgi:DNA repair protein RadC
MSDRIRELDPSQRPRERLLAFGAAALSDAELLAILLRSGQRGRGALAVANDWLAEIGGLAGLARADVRELLGRTGVGPAKAATVAATVEIGRRIAGAQLRPGRLLDRPEVAGPFVARHLLGRHHEVFGMLTLDGRHRFIALHELTNGTRSQAPVDPAELFRRAVLDRAAGVLAFHNHPSGDPEPSHDDLALTRRLAAAGHHIGVSVLDHLIVGEQRWISIRTVRNDLFANPS